MQITPSQQMSSWKKTLTTPSLIPRDLQKQLLLVNIDSNVTCIWEGISALYICTWIYSSGPLYSLALISGHRSPLGIYNVNSGIVFACL